MELDPADPIDAIALAWATERPGTPVDSIGIVTRLWQAAKLLGEDRRRTLARAGADTAVLDLLSVLRRSGSPYRLSTRELADATLVSAGAISQRVARAERDGLVTRVTRADGSRRVDVGLTAAGHALVGGWSTACWAARPTWCPAWTRTSSASWWDCCACSWTGCSANWGSGGPARSAIRADPPAAEMPCGGMPFAVRACQRRPIGVRFRRVAMLP